MKKSTSLTIVALGISFISFCQFNQQDYGDNLTYSERLAAGYYNKISKNGQFTYLGYSHEGDRTIIFFKASGGEKIGFSNWSNSSTKKYNFMAESMQGKIFRLSWKMIGENTTLLTANLDIAKRSLRYLYYANAGLTGYFDDGTVSICPRCDLLKNNVKALYTAKSLNKYVVKDGYLLVHDERQYLKKNSEAIGEGWAMINYKWLVNLEN